MKLNNKGFAVSTIMYMILVLAAILITLTLALLSGRKLILDKLKVEAQNEIYDVYSLTYRETLNILKEEAVEYASLNSVSKESIKISDLNTSIDTEILDGYELSSKYLTMDYNNNSYDIYLGETKTITDISEPIDNMIDIVDYKIGGNTYQKTYTGKNLFNAKLWSESKTEGGLTIQYLEDEDCFLINGTATNTMNFYSGYINLPNTPGTQYTISTEYISGIVDRTNGAGNKYAVAYFGDNDEINKSDNWKAVHLQEKNEFITGISNKNYITKFWFYVSDGVSFNDYKVRIQLEKGNKATAYEPYVGGVASPNPEYPSEIKSVGDLVTEGDNVGSYDIPVKVYGKNLFDKSKSNNLGIQNESGTSIWANVIFENNWASTIFKPNTTYTISYDIECIDIPEDAEQYQSGSTLGFILYRFENVVDLNSGIFMHTNEFLQEGETIHIKKTFTTPSNILENEYRMYAYGNLYIKDGNYVQTTMKFSNIQLEEGTEVTEYEPYVTTTTNIYLDEPLRKIETNIDSIVYKDQQLTKNTASLILTGSENYWSAWEGSATDKTMGVLYSNSELLGTYNAGKFKSHIGFSNYFKVENESVDTQNDDIVGIARLAATSSPPYFGFKVPYINLSDWLSYLQKINSEGNPLKVEYTLNETENISTTLPHINTEIGATRISIDTEIEPSKVEFTVIKKIRQL